MARGAEMLRLDLEAASIPYEVAGPDGPLYADFHSLRHSYITALGRGGVELRTAQELAGHSTPVLTARYSHRRLYDLATAVEKLPRFLPASLDAEMLKATGTGGRIPDTPGRGCTLVAHAAVRSGHLVASLSNDENRKTQPLETTESLVNQGLCHGQSSHCIGRLEGW